MMVRSCWKPIADGDEGDGSGRVDGLLWYKDLGNHLYGEFSMAVVQANSSLEDRGELESGPLSSNHLGPQGTFIGVYDGHGGSEASQFVSDNLFCNLKSMFFIFYYEHIYSISFRILFFFLDFVVCIF